VMTRLAMGPRMTAGPGEDDSGVVIVEVGEERREMREEKKEEREEERRDER
jgi:hypothetical protein